MENLLLEMANGEVEETEKFVVDNDLKADWCLDKIREEEAEVKRMQMVVEQKIYQLQANLEAFKSSREQTISFFESKLLEYMQTLHLKPTKAGNYTHTLPTGKIKLSKQLPEVRRNENTLLEFLKKTEPKYIKVKESVDWANLKKTLKQVDNKYVTEHGEVVEGVELLERDYKFKVEV